MRADAHSAAGLTMPWWASPAGISAGFLLPMLLLISAVDQSSFEGLTIRGVRFLTAPYVILGAGLLLMTAFGAWLGGQLKIRLTDAQALNLRAYRRAAITTGAIALVAYLFWFRLFLLHPAVLLHALEGKYRPDRAAIGQTTGLTSLVNVAPVFFSIYAFFGIALRQRLGRTMHCMCVVLLGFTLFRVYVWSERVALIEAGMPLLFAGAARLREARNWPQKLCLRLGPYAGMPLLLVYFGVAESVRSWTSATYHNKLGFWQFVSGRLTSYYYTSLNNGAGMLATTHWPAYKFELTLSWMHRAPLVGRVFSSLVNLRYWSIERFLSSYGDEEFNNPSGLYGVIYDLGLPLGILYFSAVGFCAVLLFSAYKSNRPLGFLLYPLFFLSLLEVFRYPYLGASRAFTWAIGIAIALAVAGARPRPPAAARIADRPPVRAAVSP